VISLMGPVLKTKIDGSGDQLRWPRDTPLPVRVGTYFADKWRSLYRYSLHAD
jgi:hypothetical protein